MLRIYTLLFVLIATITAHAQSTSFTVKSEPSGANIYLNDELVGKTPLRFTRKLNFKSFFKHDLKIERKGYEPVIYTYTQPPGQLIEIDVPLKRKTILASPNTELILFDKMVFDIPAGAEIGRGYNNEKIYWEGGSALGTVEFNRLAETELHELGYGVYKQTELFSDIENQKAPTLLLGATLKKINIRQAVVLAVSSYACNLDIEWKLYNKKLNKVVGTFNTKGSKTVKGTVLAKAVHESFADALYELAADSAFMKAVLSPSATRSATAANQKTINISRPKPVKFTQPSQMISTSIQSVVTVKHNAGHGSGFLISDDGYILTNWHVVQGQDDITVTFSNGLSLPVKVFSYDEDYDLALLKVPGSGYKALTLGDSDSVLVGSDLVAIGTPRDTDLGQTVTKGILSGKRQYQDHQYLQTDVSVHPGNSGGPLLDGNGKVIGIITYKYKDAEGLNFAIPSNAAIERLGIKFN